MAKGKAKTKPRARVVIAPTKTRGKPSPNKSPRAPKAAKKRGKSKPAKKSAAKRTAPSKARKPAGKVPATTRAKKSAWERLSPAQQFAARSKRAARGWETRRNKARQTKRRVGLADRKKRGTLTEYDKRVQKIDAIRARIARGGRITGKEFSDTFGYIKRDGSIAVTWSKLRVLDDAEKLIERMESKARWSPDWHDEAAEIAEEYDVEPREVYSLVMSP